MKPVHLLTLFVLAACSSCENQSSFVSLKKLSPDQKYVVTVLELPGFDRNFQILVTETASNSVSKVVYTSPDEGRPVGTERIFWTTDSEAFLLVGLHFFTRNDLRIRDGHNIYLFYNVKTGELRANASQNALPGMDLTELRKLTWEREIF